MANEARLTKYRTATLKHLRHDWFFHLVQLGSVVFALYWWRHLPAPGYAIGVLALLAALMSFHGEMTKWDKATWTLTMAAFLMVEFSAIANSNQQEAARRNEENKQFRDIADRIEDATTRLETLKSVQENSRTETAVGFQKTFSLLDFVIGHSKSPEDKAAAAQIQKDLLKRFLSEVTVATLQTLTHDVIHRLTELHDDVLHAAIRLEDAASMRDTATILMRQKELKEAEDNYGPNKIWSDEVIPLRDELIKRHLDDYVGGLQSEIDRHDGKIH